MCLLSLISLVDKRIDDISQYEGVIIKVIQADDIAAFHGCHIIAKMSSISKVSKLENEKTIKRDIKLRPTTQCLFNVEQLAHFIFYT